MRKRIVSIAMFAALAIAPMAASLWAAPQAGSPSGKPAASAAHPGAPAHAGTASLLNPATLKLQAPAVFDIRFTTTKGDFVVEVTRAWAPRGADRFYNLVKNRFYDDAAFFRVMQGFVAQFGISARPDVSQAWANATIEDDPVSQHNTRGTLTFATAGANTRTTQIFINLADNSNLDGMGFTPFGNVVSGMDVVDKLYSEYGDGAPDGNGPDQNRLEREGKPYLEKSFPLLDSIKATVLVPPAPAARPPASGPAK